MIVAAAQLERQRTDGISLALWFNLAALGRQSGRPTHIPPLDGARFAAPLVMYGELCSGSVTEFHTEEATNRAPRFTSLPWLNPKRRCQRRRHFVARSLYR